MNPITINTANVIQFGFRSSFMLEESTVVFDIAGITTFKPGGANNIVGISFEVIDPSGSYLNRIDWNNPDIVPGSGAATFEVDLSGYPVMFGWYNIRGVLREQNGSDYPITIRKEICKPVGFKNGIVEANLQEIIDCNTPKVGVTDVTNYSYLGKSPEQQIKNGLFIYPPGTLDTIPFTYTPFEVYGSGNVYTGDYTVREKIFSYYNLGDLVTVVVSYNGILKFTVTCTSNLCAVMCCLEKLQDVAKNQCNTPAGIQARKKLDEAAIPFMLAVTQEKCGVNSGETVEEVMKILGCDCNCENESVEPSPIITVNQPTVLNGICGTNATYDSLTGIWTIRSRTINIAQAATLSQAMEITSEQTDCSVNWNIVLSPDILTGEILQSIADSPIYLALFNSLVNQTGLDLSELGQNCVIDTTTCNYTLAINVVSPAMVVNNIVVNGITSPSPAILANNAAGLQSWLNTLNLGVFIVNYDSNTQKTTITTNNNTNTVGTMALSLNGIQQVFQFSRSCGSIIAVLKAILNYLCGLVDENVGIGRSYAICTLAPNGTISTQTINPGTNKTLADVLTAFSASLCTSIASVLQLAKVSCASIQTTFSDRTTAINTTFDVLYGTRGATNQSTGTCGAVSWEEFARTFFTFMVNTNQQDIIDLFCQTKDRCFTPVCNPVQSSTIELIQPCPGIAAITGAFTT
jgi:hypothetical protein